MTTKKNADPIVTSLRKIREELSIKQYELADTIGLGSASTMASYELGTVSPQLDVLRDWAYALDQELQMVPVEKKKSRTRPAEETPEPVADNSIVVRLSQYQAALAMGILTGDAHTISSPKLSKDVLVIAELLAIALGS